jgi:tRNA(Ile)-lysidine synthase
VGVGSTIIPLAWPEGVDLKHNPKFESDARSLRFQALGKACRDKGIRSLLLGHHADDQVESIFLRIMNARIRTGATGMNPVGWIPECHGIHGVYRSGSPASERSSVSSLFEHGGVQVVRPLLSFEKSRLVATCETHGTRWAEDKTNQDRTLTPRNAVRHIIRNHKLPEALSKNSILAVGEKLRSRSDKPKAAAEVLFNSCPLELDIQTASLTVRLPPVEAFFTHPTSVAGRLPPIKALFTDPTSVASPAEKLQARNTAQFLLHRVLELVSPMEKPVLESVSNAVLYLYPYLAPDDSQRNRVMISPNNGTSSGCAWSRAGKTTLFHHSPADPAINHLDELTIHRQPLNLTQLKTSSLEFSPQQASDWQFFDGRYWIRVQNLTDRPIFLRALSNRDLEELLQTDPKGHLDPQDPEARTFERRKRMRLALDTIKPHALRRHLPALFLAPVRPWQQATLLALPTLQSSPETHDAQGKWECTWGIRYKQIDPGARSLSEIVRTPVWHDLELDPVTQEQEDARRKLDLLFAEENLQSS